MMGILEIDLIKLAGFFMVNFFTIAIKHKDNVYLY